MCGKVRKLQTPTSSHEHAQRFLTGVWPTHKPFCTGCASPGVLTSLPRSMSTLSYASEAISSSTLGGGGASRCGRDKHGKAHTAISCTHVPRCQKHVPSHKVVLIAIVVCGAWMAPPSATHDREIHKKLLSCCVQRQALEITVSPNKKGTYVLRTKHLEFGVRACLKQ